MSDIAATTAGIDVTGMSTASTAAGAFPMEDGNVHGKHVTDDGRGRSGDRWESGRARDSARPSGDVGLGFGAEEMTQGAIAATQFDEPVRMYEVGELGARAVKFAYRRTHLHNVSAITSAAAAMMSAPSTAFYRIHVVSVRSRVSQTNQPDAPW